MHRLTVQHNRMSVMSSPAWFYVATHFLA